MSSPLGLSGGDRDGVDTAAIYARTSSPGQTFGYSMDEQVRRCLERCFLQDWHVVFVFRDVEESGKDIDRPMFQLLMKQAEHDLHPFT